MSFDLDKIIKESSLRKHSTNREKVHSILGHCIAEDILSSTSELKPVWNLYDRYSLIKTICERLNLQWRYELPLNSLTLYYPIYTLYQGMDCLYYEPYALEGWI